MTGKIRCGTTLLIAAALTCGSLGAAPVGHRAMLGDDGVPVITAFVDWVSSLFWVGSHSKVPRQPRSKYASQVDPDGHH
jgi:hypothetical protein